MSDDRSSRSEGLGRDSARDPLARLGASDPLARLGRLSWRRPRRGAARAAIVVGSLVGILVGLGVTVAAVSGVAAGIRDLTKPSTAVPAVADGGAVTEHMSILTNTTGQLGGQPKYTNTSWTVKKGEKVTVIITSYDTGTAPLQGAQMMFAKVQGTTTGTEQVGSKTVSSVSDVMVAHTFTVPALNFNMPIPVATHGHVTVTATFVPTKTGTFVWQCYAPCGSGSNGAGGAMSTTDWMEGNIKVVNG